MSSPPSSPLSPLSSLSDTRPRTPTPPSGFEIPTCDLPAAIPRSLSPAQAENRPAKRRRVEPEDASTTIITTETQPSSASNPVDTETAAPSLLPKTPTKMGGRRKVESPPWKSAGADGPTTILENGRRKSGRISIVQSQKVVETSTPPPQPTVPASASRRLSRSEPQNAPLKHNGTLSVTYSRRLGRAVKTETPQTKSATKTKEVSSARSRRLSPSPTPAPAPSRQSTRTRTAQHSTGSTAPLPTRTIRITGRSLRNTQTVYTEIPLIHPLQVPLRPRLATSLEEYFAMAGKIPTIQGGFGSGPDEEINYHLSDEQATQEALAIMRIERELEDGGILTEERCSVFMPEICDAPARQWAHYDHLVKAAQNLRRLMNAEQVRHRQTAKKLAEACREQWLRRQPKSEEQLAEEVRKMSIARYRIVVRAVAGMWDNVKAEVNRRRLAEWEAAEQKRVKEALNEAVNKSEAQLQARRNTLGGDGSEEDDLEGEDDEDMMTGSAASGDDSLLNEYEDSGESGDSERGDENEEDMSSDEDEDKANAGEVDDEQLSAEQLKAKYQNLPDVMPDILEAEIAIKADDASTTDESINMDDDLGSSEMSDTGLELDDEDDEEKGDEEEDSDKDDGILSHSLAGMLFSKKELKAIKQEEIETPDAETLDGPEYTPVAETTTAEGTPAVVNLDVVEPMMMDGVDDEVSLVPVPYTPTNDGDAEEKQGKTEEVKTSAPSNAVSPKSPSKTAPPVISIETPEIDVMEEVVDSKPADHPTTSPAPAPASEPEDVVIADDSVVPTVEASQVTPTPEATPGPAESVAPAEATSSEHLSVAHTPATSASPAPTTMTNTETTGPKTQIPFLLRGTLREYQHQGLDWLAGLYANNTNGILADEMGLGKTIQTISLLAHLACHHGIWGPHLVVVPTSVMLNWEMEFKKWCPGFKIMAYYGSIEERRRKRAGWSKDELWNVCITSYQLVLQDNQVFRRRRWHYLILDEAHNIKNFKSMKWRTLLGFNTQARLLITGTPLQNNLTELWSLLYFLMPAATEAVESGAGAVSAMPGFAGLDEFHLWFAKPESTILESGREHLDDEGRAIIQKLHKVLRPYLLRRLKADVEKQMPAKHEHVEYCRLSKRQRELYDGFLARSDTRATLAGGNYLSIINCLMQLRKVCNHPDLFVDRPIQTSLRLPQSVPAGYQFVNSLVRRRLLRKDPMQTVSLSFLNLVPAELELGDRAVSAYHASRIFDLGLPAELLEARDVQKKRLELVSPVTMDPTTVRSAVRYLEGSARFSRLEELHHCVYLNTMQRQRTPILGRDVTALLTLDTESRPRAPRPKVPAKVMEWFENESFLLKSAVKNINQRSTEMELTITKFACVTPAVVTRDPADVLLGIKGAQAFHDEDLRLSKPVRWSPFIPPEPPVDPWHEARIRLSIQFPDKRLLQYDCGKLQALDRLLRRLQAGGHRALIFTQMTRVLDILEQFLNIHGHKYLRLDGATKVEQRQLLTDRFNSDKRILAFILSTRSGGLGINLTGADTVIFYDQDWNPAMDKQCQDRCHRIGQTRDVHIYRLVSEHTIEANILRKASQKQMLDDVVIQDGAFTTEYFASSGRRRAAEAEDDEENPEADLEEGIAAASAAMDRVLGQAGETGGGRLDEVEDQEDVTAAKAVEREIAADEGDFSERKSVSESVVPEAESMEEAGGKVKERNADGGVMGDIDEFMVGVMEWLLQGVPVEMLRKDKKKEKRGAGGGGGKKRERR